MKKPSRDREGAVYKSSENALKAECRIGPYPKFLALTGTRRACSVTREWRAEVAVRLAAAEFLWLGG